LPGGTTSPSSSRGPTPPPAAADASPRRPRRWSQTASASPFSSPIAPKPGSTSAPRFAPQRGEPTYAEKIRSADRQLDLTRPAVELVRVVRALCPHIGARAMLEGRPVTLWRARVGDDGSFEPLEVQPEGGRRMSAEAWRRGLR
jgi:hypothetical protein